MRAFVLGAASTLVAACALAALPSVTACATTPLPRPTTTSEAYTVDGRVVGVDEAPPERPLATNVRITLRADPDPVVVELAPGWVLDEHGLRFDREDAVRVQGVLQEDGSVRAHRVRAGDADVTLRNADGSPTWQPR